LVKDVTEAAPSTEGLLSQISELVLNRDYYQALKLTRKLMAYEQEAMKHVCTADSGV